MGLKISAGRVKDMESSTPDGQMPREASENRSRAEEDGHLGQRATV